MQSIKYLPDPRGFLERSAIERYLFNTCGAFTSEVLFDCAEFGFCLVRWVTGAGHTATWYHREPSRRRAKPKIAVTVTQLDGVWGNFRKRWYFALSKLGLLYPVAYEEQRKQDGTQWETTNSYHAWRRYKESVHFTTEIIPDDTVCREAERLWKLKRMKHMKHKHQS